MDAYIEDFCSCDDCEVREYCNENDVISHCVYDTAMKYITFEEYEFYIEFDIFSENIIQELERYNKLHKQINKQLKKDIVSFKKRKKYKKIN